MTTDKQTRCICSHSWTDHQTRCYSDGCACRFTPQPAAQPDVEALDVDRLARALILTGLYIDDSPAPPKELAADLAAEYAALDRLDR